MKAFKLEIEFNMGLSCVCVCSAPVVCFVLPDKVFFAFFWLVKVLPPLRIN